MEDWRYQMEIVELELMMEMGGKALLLEGESRNGIDSRLDVG